MMHLQGKTKEKKAWPPMQCELCDPGRPGSKSKSFEQRETNGTAEWKIQLMMPENSRESLKSDPPWHLVQRNGIHSREENPTASRSATILLQGNFHPHFRHESSRLVETVAEEAARLEDVNLLVLNKAIRNSARPAKYLDAQRRRLDKLIAWNALIFSALEEALALSYHNGPFAESATCVFAGCGSLALWLRFHGCFLGKRLLIGALRHKQVVRRWRQARGEKSHWPRRRKPLVVDPLERKSEAVAAVGRHIRSVLLSRWGRIRS